MAIKTAMQTSLGSLRPLEFVATLLEKMRPLEAELDKETEEKVPQSDRGRFGHETLP